MTPYKEAILNHLRLLAKAGSTEQYEKALKGLERSDLWNDNYGKMFRVWFENTWLRVKKVSITTDIGLGIPKPAGSH